MNSDAFEELAAAFASGELEAAEEATFFALLASASANEKAMVRDIVDTASLIALSIPPKEPPVSLREKILQMIRAPASTPELFEFVLAGEESLESWITLGVPGAKMKLLSMQRDKGYAVILGKLAPNTHYPAHQHFGAEQIYLLKGDLQIGEVTLKAGDFHNAAAGSIHGANFSRNGCTILAILSTEDLAAHSAV